MSHQEKSETVSRRSVLTGSLPAATLAGLAALQSDLRASDSLNIPLRVFLGNAQDAEPVLNDLDQDPNLVGFVTSDLNPLLKLLPEGLSKTPAFVGPLPTVSLSDSDIALLHQELASLVPVLAEQAPTPGPLPGPQDIDALITAAITRFQTILSTPSLDPTPALINQLHDFNATIIGNVYIALDQLGAGAVIFSPATPISLLGSPPDWTDQQWILVVSLVIELIGLLAGVAGIVLPKVPLGPVVKALLPFLKSPSVRTGLTTLLATLANDAASLADKAGAILKFLGLLSSLGALSETLSAILSGLSLVDWLKIALQLSLAIAGFLLPATSAATAARIAFVLTTSLAEIVSKITKLK